jgi:hypothetical protein
LFERTRCKLRLLAPLNILLDDRQMMRFSQFRRALVGGAVYFLAIACTQALADQWVEPTRHNVDHVEIRILSMNREEKALNRKEVPDPNGPRMVLACRDSTFNIFLDWREPVGQLEEKRRHIFYHADGYNHLMLPVLDRTGQSTGYIQDSAKAKALVNEILLSLKQDFIPIGVFPAGRDIVTGKWIDAWFPAAAFRSSALTMGNTCKFDPIRVESAAHAVDKVPPAWPGSQ